MRVYNFHAHHCTGEHGSIAEEVHRYDLGAGTEGHLDEALSFLQDIQVAQHMKRKIVTGSCIKYALP